MKTMDELNADGAAKGKKAKARLKALIDAGGQESDLWLQLRHDMFPHEMRVPIALSESRQFLTIGVDKESGLYYIMTISHTFITATKYPTVVMEALEDPKGFYEAITRKPWPYGERKRTAPASRVEVDMDLENLL